jgi:hypothetical protein
MVKLERKNFENSARKQPTGKKYKKTQSGAGCY